MFSGDDSTFNDFKLQTFSSLTSRHAGSSMSSGPGNSVHGSAPLPMMGLNNGNALPAHFPSINMNTLNESQQVRGFKLSRAFGIAYVLIMHSTWNILYLVYIYCWTRKFRIIYIYILTHTANRMLSIWQIINDLCIIHFWVYDTISKSLFSQTASTYIIYVCIMMQ